MEILIHCISSSLMDIMILCIYSSWIFWSIYIVHGDDHTCHILYHTYSWPLYSYVFEAAVCTCSNIQRYLYNIVGWLVLPPGSSSLHFSDGLIMYFGHHITPLTSHIRGHLLQLILPHMVDHTFMAFPIPLQTLWTPWTICVPLMFPISSLKTPIIWCMRLLIPFLRIYVDIILKPVYIGMCA